MNDSRRGLGYGAGAYLLWGLFPLYWPLLEPAGAVEILAHRIVWTVGVVFALLAFGGRWRQLAALRHDHRALLLLPASLLIAINWGSYIWGVNHARVVETSLGYFVNPLFTVLLGVLVLGERLRRTQWLAIGVGSTAVILLAVDYGHPPWVALTLAGSFGFYGLCKKTARVGAVESLTVETGVLFLPALGYLGWLTVAGHSSLGHVSTLHTALLVCSGPVTAVPLLMFGAAAVRLPLVTIGLVQYLAPVLQFLCGVLIFGEPMPVARLGGFALVWTALVILAVDGVRQQRRQIARTPTEPTEPTEGLAAAA